jgi:drug/metabolite transporter (DMT)-like permease
VRTAGLTAAALTGFAANSLLTRGALDAGAIDAASFTALRLLTGALTLLLIVWSRGSPSAVSRETGSWRSALALAGYAVCFTVAYLRIGAGVGALVLFGAVQVTMIGTGLVRGERPARIDWLGVGLAVAGLLILTLPGATAPDPAGAALMALAGACWGVYSLAGRSSRDPLGSTAGNFVRATAFGALFVLLVAVTLASVHATTRGVAMAALSGSVASGVAYTIWYSVLPALASWRAAIVQLIVPVLTAVAASMMLGESITLRLGVAALLVAAGVGCTVWPAWHK